MPTPGWQKQRWIQQRLEADQCAQLLNECLPSDNTITDEDRRGLELLSSSARQKIMTALRSAESSIEDEAPNT